MLEYSPWLCWILPIAGAMLTPALAKVGSKPRDYGAVAFSLASAIMASSIAIAYPKVLEGGSYYGFHPLSIKWIDVAGVHVEAGVLVDPLSYLMVNVVAWISFLIMVYSLEYMHGDPGLTRYWFFMNFFIGSMLLLVLSDNFIQLLFGWEGVGLCSYALIGYWYQDREEDRKDKWVGVGAEEYPPSHAGMKAFVTTRAADALMLAGIFLIYSQAHTFNFIELEGNLQWCRNLADMGLLVPTILLLLSGPLGKSAQLPFMEWLPDAMAGPTSVSALIHAATMVKAGVYLVARLFPIFYLASVNGLAGSIAFFQAVAAIGATTAFVSATQAMVSKELKKVWAYSTVSQIGYMMLGLGVAGLLTGDLVVAAFTAAILHLVSHAVFKAALFLSSGAAIHACESRFMDHMGGLREHMPLTFTAMFLAALALAGVPPLSGFWSKEAILHLAAEALELSPASSLLYALGTLTVALTFFYSLRAIGMVFFGRRISGRGEHVHEAKPLMWIPYITLAFSSIGLGLTMPTFLESLLNGLFHRSVLAHLVHEAYHAGHGSELITTLVPMFSAVMLVVGGIPAAHIYIMSRYELYKGFIRNSFAKGLHAFFFNRWYVNRTYYKIFVDSTLLISKTAYKFVEVSGLDRFNYLLAGWAVAAYGRLRKLHTGILTDYMMGLAIGLLALIAILLWFGGV